MLPEPPPPTSFLPPINKLACCSPDQLSSSVRLLRDIYSPPVRGTHRRKAPIVSVGEKDGCEDLSTLQSTRLAQLEILRTDSFERSYAVRWLTALIAQIQTQEWTKPWLDDTTESNPDSLVDQAASLLALCCGTSAAGVMTRNFVFSSEQTTVQVGITDIPLDNCDFSSVGAQTWGGSCVLSELIVEQPRKFIPAYFHNSSSRPLRILELGAGTGLVVLTVAKLVHQQPSLCLSEVDIVATDYYPSVLTNLQKNIASNLPMNQRPQVVTEFLDWSQFPRDSCPAAALNQTFDVVFGADLVYDHDAPQARLIYDCLQLLLRKPSNNDDLGGLFHLLIALRPGFEKETASILNTFPHFVNKPNQAQQLCVLSLDEITCDVEEEGGRVGGDANDDEHDAHVVRYGYYVIGWK
jgi:SAM-dependent methyltransferase